MVLEHPETRLDSFVVDGPRLLKDGNPVAAFPSAICEIGRLNDRLFILLDPYPALADVDYAGTNLWCLDFDGRVLWKAKNLNVGWKPSKTHDPNCYRAIIFLNEGKPIIFARTWDDHLAPFIDPLTGEVIPGNGQTTPIEHLRFAEATAIAWLSPNEPPRPPKLAELAPN